MRSLSLCAKLHVAFDCYILSRSVAIEDQTTSSSADIQIGSMRIPKSGI